MSRCIVLQHVPFEGPGRVIPVFRDFGIPCEVRHLYQGDEVPTDLEEVRVLVVLGGPMGVADVGGEKFPFLAKIVRQRLTGACRGESLVAVVRRTSCS